MKRFFFEEEEDDDNDDDEMMDDSRAFPEMVPEFFAMAHGLDNPSQHVLNYSIRICEQTFLWRFKSMRRKMEMIESVFHTLNALVEGGRNIG